jgi:hypothetical protein
MLDADADWDLVYLEYCFEFCSKSSKLLLPAYEPYCTAATIYNCARSANILKCLETEQKLIDFAYASCIKAGPRLRAFVANPALFAQDGDAGAGDLNHLGMFTIQFWMNLFVDMYNSRGDRRFRLPACRNTLTTLSYVRWGNVLVALLILTAAFFATFYLYIRLLKKTFAPEK